MSLTESELDRLADYTVDVLDPADAAEVADLIRTDPRWSRAYHELTGADAAVRSDLRTVGADDISMPDDVVAALDRALAGLSVVSLYAARARRRRRFATVVASAAAGAVAIAGGLSLVNGLREESLTSAAPNVARDSGEAAADAAGPNVAGAPVPPAAAVQLQVVSSGTDYSATTLSTLAASVFTASQPAVDAGKAGEVPRSVVEAAPGVLARLTQPAALADCLSAVLARHPGAVSLLDYARYAGSPALVLVVRQVAGSTVVAVGERCGIDGPDEKIAVSGS